MGILNSIGKAFCKVGHFITEGLTTVGGAVAGAAVGTIFGGPFGLIFGAKKGAEAGNKVGDKIADFIYGQDEKPKQPEQPVPNTLNQPGNNIFVIPSPNQFGYGYQPPMYGQQMPYNPGYGYQQPMFGQQQYPNFGYQQPVFAQPQQPQTIIIINQQAAEKSATISKPVYNGARLHSAQPIRV